MVVRERRACPAESFQPGAGLNIRGHMGQAHAGGLSSECKFGGGKVIREGMGQAAGIGAERRFGLRYHIIHAWQDATGVGHQH